MNQIRVGVMGAGHISAAHLHGWQRAKGCVVTAVCDRDVAAAESRAAAFGVSLATGDFQRLLETCDVVDVCTPPQTHAGILRECVDASRHVLVEKPALIDVEDWYPIREAALAGGLHIAVVHNIKFTRAFQTAIRSITDGAIGQVMRIRREFLTSPSTDRMLRGNHWSHALPGGRWFETLPHELYVTHRLAGALPLVSAVASRRSAGEPIAGAEAEDVTLVLADDTCIATIHYSARCELNRRTIEITGTQGRIEIDILSDTMQLFRRGDSKMVRILGGASLDAAGATIKWPANRSLYLWDRLRGITPHSRLIAAFARQLKGGAPATPLDEIEYVIEQSSVIGQAIDDAIGMRRS